MIHTKPLKPRKTKDVDEQIASFERMLENYVREACNEASEAHERVGSAFDILANMNAVDDDEHKMAIESAQDASERALATRKAARVMHNLVHDSAFDNLLPVLNEAARLGICDLRDESMDRPEMKWLHKNIDKAMRDAVLDRHFQTHRMDEEIFEELMEICPPAITLLMQAIFAPSHSNIAA